MDPAHPDKVTAGHHLERVGQAWRDTVAGAHQAAADTMETQDTGPESPSTERGS